MKKLILSIFILLGFTKISFAQEVMIPTATQYLADNEFVIAPTYAGIGDYVKIRLNGFAQWIGIKDAPDNQTFVGDMRLGMRSGVGLLLYRDRNGNTQQSGLKASFAHHLTLDKAEKQFLSFGLSYNLNQFRIATENFDVGVLYRSGGFFANLTVGNILNKDMDIFAINEPNKLRNYSIYTGYRYKRYNNGKFEFEPSVFYQLYESDGRSSTDINIKARLLDFEDYYWAGITYRFLNDQIARPLTVGPMFGLKKSNLYFGYSYQITLNELSMYNSGTHMVTIGLDLFQGISNCPCMMR